MSVPMGPLSRESGEIDPEIERARARLAAHLGAGADEVALTGNATDGIALVAAGLRWEEGDEIIISDQEHPAMAVPFAHTERRWGVKVRQYRVGWDPEDSLRSVRSLITPRTRLVATSHVTSPHGIRLPVREIVALAHEHGVPVLVDAAQSFAVMALDARDLGCEFLSGNGHKWLGGPKGTGFLYARRDWMERLEPPLVGDGSMVRETATPHPTGHRFEFGTRGFATPAGLNDALDWLEGWGLGPGGRADRRAQRPVSSRARPGPQDRTGSGSPPPSSTVSSRWTGWRCGSVRSPPAPEQNAGVGAPTDLSAGRIQAVGAPPTLSAGREKPGRAKRAQPGRKGGE